MHPDHRGKGVYSSIWKLKEKINAETGVLFRWSLTANLILIRLYRRENSEVSEPEFPRQLKQYVSIKDVDMFLDHLKRRRDLDWKYLLKTKIGYNLLKKI